MRRIVYSPEVQVFIKPGGLGPNGNGLPAVDISNDIIEGSIIRKSDDISTARFVVQNRRVGSNVIEKESDQAEESVKAQKLLFSNFRPMDRIVVYLKKTKPILVFTGYLDLVPMIQFVPEPVVIEASCTLKRLQFTYWDPTLPKVMNMLIKIGFVPDSAGDQGLSVLQVPSDATIENGVQDTGFPLLLQFLLQDVGGWANKDIFIEPIPQTWLDDVKELFETIQGQDTTTSDTKSFLSTVLGAAGGSGGPDSDVTSSTDSSPIVDINKVKKYLTDNNAAQWIIDGIQSVFIKAGNRHNVDPRFLIAITLNETTWGKDATAVRHHNPGGLGGAADAITYPSWEAGVDAMAGPDVISGYKPNTIAGIGAIYCPPNASNDAGQNYKWPSTVGSLFAKMGGDPNADVKGPNYIKALKQATSAAATRATASPYGDVSSKRANKNLLTVYIEAFDAPENDAVNTDPNKDITLRQPGYQEVDIVGRGLDTDRSKRRIRWNIELANRVRNELANLAPGEVQLFLGTDNSRFKNATGYNGDIYLTIDHSDWIYSVDYDVSGHAASDVHRGLAYPPTQYSKGFSKDKGGVGIGWKTPLKTSAADKGLIQNSKKLLQDIAGSKSQIKNFTATFNGNGHAVSLGPSTIPDNIPDKNSDYNFIPGFFYSNTAAALYLQFPTIALQGGSELDPNDNVDLDKLFDARAKQIALGLYNYLKSYKSKGKQAAVASGNTPVTDGTDGNGTSMVGSEKFFNPLGKAKWGQGSGVRDHQTGRPGVQGKNWQSDFAMDMTVPYGTPVFAPFNGKIVKAGSLNSKNPLLEGLRIGLQGDGGYSAYLAHLSSISVKEGDTVVGGQQIGLSGRAGIDHLHFGMAKGPYDAPYDAGIDPTPFLTGASTNVSTNGTGDGTGASGSGSGDTVQAALNAAFNVSFNFPGSLADSLILRGQRALENDVPLINSVAEVTKASMRSFSSLPNGAFVAWYPDYFNLSKRTAWLKISPMELKSCTIDLSDKSLTTHVYVLGNTQGLGSNPDAAAASTWLEKLKGTGVVTIEQSKILDSFLGSGFKDYLDVMSFGSLDPFIIKKQSVKKKGKKKPVTRETKKYLNKDMSAPLAFLERYGARPYLEQNLTIRHPLFEFFYAYHTFIQKWAEQFISKIELTFMPELFPGMIIEIDDPYKRNITFYVQDVTHNFSYQTGFNTTATLIAPGRSTTAEITRENPAYGLVPVALIDNLTNKPKAAVTPTGAGKPNKLTYKQWLKKHGWGSTAARSKQYKQYLKKP
jgi:murein DD-endopeptidase MepM/ murein hydrolase activator NlpD